VNEKKMGVKYKKLNEARYHLTIQEQRILLLISAEIKPNDEDFKNYSFPVKEFVDLLGFTGNSAYGHLKKNTMVLRDKSFTIHESDGILQIGWLNSVKYYDNESRFELSFSPKLKPYLLHLKKEFARDQFHNVIRLKSSYSIRVYDLLKQYLSKGCCAFDLDELRSILCVPENSLKKFHDFRKVVLEVAHKELVNSDILFNYEPIKKIRKVVAIKFIIKPNEKMLKKFKKEEEMIERQKILDEQQSNLDLQQKKEERLDIKLKKLEEDHPDKFKKLKKQAKKRLKRAEKKNPEVDLSIKSKMFDLLTGFLQKEKLKI